jgi:FlaA1/EpsC-like NDP-sugar epimerase
MRRRIRSAAVPVHRHSLPQLAVDGALVAAAYVLAFHLRFDGTGALPHRYERLLEHTLPWVVPACLVVFALFGLYAKWWRYVGRSDFEALAKAVVVATVLVVGAIAILHPVTIHPLVRGHGHAYRATVAVSMPSGVAALFLMLQLVLLGGARWAVYRIFQRPLRGFRARKGAQDVLIVGAGEGGQMVLREMVRNPELGYRPVGFLDDDPRKQGMRLGSGLRVLGTTRESALPRVLDEVEPDEVIIAIPSAPGTLRRRVVAACRERGIPVRTTPTVFELLRGGTTVMRQVRDVRVEDVLGREPVRMELERVGAYLSGQVVMVTGAGGSIGAELCRQIARVAPRKLVLLDHAEDNLFDICRELEEDRHFHGSVAVLADCKEEERVREVLREHRPQVIFHAAAYKHVGMMEANPVEAVRNNALATRVVARVAGEARVGTFVLISTDKAVAPATVMGASKALAEWAVEAAAAGWPGTRYATVRFGNVLGSSGSVVTIFRRQIAQGGPLTVTDPKMTRYFMTIPEAVQLVIRAGSLPAASGAVFVLDMGEPVRIMDLAEQMIGLSGLEPERDIAIEIVGRRPGEKLHEDLFNPYEVPQPTPAEKILRAERAPLEVEWVEATFGEINLLVLEGDAAGLAAKVAELSSVRVGAAAVGEGARPGA